MKLRFLLGPGLFVLVSAFGNPEKAQAVTYYVDQNNVIANDTNPGTVDRPWKTISKANQTLIAGDTVYLKAGTYTSYIAPTNSGTNTQPIAYRNYSSDTVTISNTSYGIRISGKSYVSVQGINFYLLDHFLVLENGANHNFIAYCNFDQGRNMGRSGSQIVGSSQYNWIHHCQFSNYGNLSSIASGSVFDIGDEESQTDLTRYNLIENNTMFHGGHHVIGVMGQYNVIRNNYFHNENWSNGYGYRVVYLNGETSSSGINVIESNRIGYAGAYESDNNSAGMLLASTRNIVRRNLFYYNDGSGIAMSANTNYISDIVHNKIYNNTFLHNGWDTDMIPDAMTSAIGLAVYGGAWVVRNNDIKNNIFYDHYQVFGTYHASTSDQAIAGNWNGDSQGDPLFVLSSKTLGDPADPTFPDLHLQPISPCIDAGTYLTTITSGSSSGSTFQVADASNFIDGWGIAGVQGDEIQLYGSFQRARIVSVEYTTNTITVDRTLSWTQNQGIALSFESSAPDIGAYESPVQENTPAAPRNLRVKVP